MENRLIILIKKLKYLKKNPEKPRLIDTITPNTPLSCTEAAKKMFDKEKLKSEKTE